MMRLRQSQQGFVIVAAIFLLVVLATLGAFMVTFSNTQQLTSSQDVQGSRAYWAARAGVEWAVSSINATVPAPVCPASPASFNVDGFALSVSCNSQAYNESGITKTVFSITSQASAGGALGSLGHVERSVSATVEF